MREMLLLGARSIIPQFRCDVKMQIAPALALMLLTASAAAAQSTEEPAKNDEPNWTFKWAEHPSVLFGD